jgi:hypothetical protein
MTPTEATSVYRIDPLVDPRWGEFLAGHPDASVFHTPAWLQALQLTYGYRPEGFTTSAPGPPLQDAVVVCRVDSWLTGARLVSLPFADHCQPLGTAQSLATLIASLKQASLAEGDKYLEFRWISSPALTPSLRDGLHEETSYQFHSLDLQPTIEELFRGFHKSCIQRKIRRAEREGLEYEAGSSPEMLRDFYRLLIVTRKRHGLPPPPLRWFQNLRNCFGDGLKIHLAKQKGRPLASILTLTFKERLVYKYGGSDAYFHHLGTMPWLFWQVIQDGKNRGLAELDLGRSDVADQGLIAFKNHLGARSSILTNYRYPMREQRSMFQAGELVRGWCRHLPGPVLRAAGTLLYRHIG